MWSKKCSHHECSKTCSHHECSQTCSPEWKWKKCPRLLWAGILTFLVIVLLVILIVWAILQPHKPRFILQDATIFNFNVSAPNILSTTIQVTIYSRNPNDNIGIYYAKAHVFATYCSQQITYYTATPPVYQGHKDVNVWSPFIYGNNVPIAPYNGVSLSQDQSNGAVWLMIKMDGRVKWKVGSYVSGSYHLHVTCPAYIPFGNKGNTGIVIGNAIKFQLSQSCSVSV